MEESQMVLATGYVDLIPILEELEEEWWGMGLTEDSPDVYELIQLLKVELRLLNTFLTCTTNWNHASKDPLVRCLVFDIEAALKEGINDLRKAHGLKRRDDFAVSGFGDKIEHFRPRIKDAYAHLLSSPLRSKFAFPMFGPDLWPYFSEYLEQNMLGLCREKINLPVVVRKELKILAHNLQSLTSFMMSFSDWEEIAWYTREDNLLVHLEAQGIRAAHLAALCLLREMDENMAQEITIMLSDVRKNFWPTTRKVGDMYVKVLESIRYPKCNITEVVMDAFVNFLAPAKDQLQTLHKGLRFLLRVFVVDYFVRGSVFTDFAALLTEVGSLSYSFQVKERTQEAAREADSALFVLLESIELLKAEILLNGLLLDQLAVTLLEVPLNDQIDSLFKGLSILGTFLPDPHEGKTEIAIPMWMHIEAVVREASSLYHSFLAGKIFNDGVKEGALMLHEKIKFFKTEVFYGRLLNSIPNLMVPMNDQIQTLYEWFIFHRTLAMSPLDENGKLILTRAESAAKYATSFYHKFHPVEFTKNVFTEMNLELPDIVEKTMLVKAEVREIYLRVRSSLRSNFPKANGLHFVDFLIGKLREMLSRNVDAIASVRHQIEVADREINTFRSFLLDISGQPNGHPDLKILGSRIIDVAYEAEHVIDCFFVRECALWYHYFWLSDVIEEIKHIKVQVSEIYEKKSYGIGVHTVAQTSRSATSPPSNSRIEEVLVDLPDQAELIINRLKRGTLKQDIVSIVGMPGLGKTTLAKKVYNEPSIIYHFHLRAWCHVSQAYQKRKLLIEILNELSGEHSQYFTEMNDEDLEFELYQCLKRRRYLIVMDDIWSVETWTDLKTSFPDDENGSRILITSRLHDVAFQVKPDSKPHALRLLTDVESCSLLQKKIFGAKNCPEELLKVGEQIAKNCKGLPLAVVAVAGLLKKAEKEKCCWKKIAGSLGSLIEAEPQTRCMEILELSYTCLPDYLKPCFLYLGAFSDGKEIPVRKLKCLWIAEGLIRNTESESLEDVAEKYLTDLIGKSLVMVAKIRSKGGVKACHVHDMLRDLCLAKCKEEKFSQLITGYDEQFPSSSSDLDYGVDYDYNNPSLSVAYEKHQLIIYSKRKHFVMARPSGALVRSLLFFAMPDTYPRCPYNVSFICHNFKLLRVLDLECINMGHSFPEGIEYLVHLRYLALSGDIDSIPSSIANLWNLETFLMKGLKGKVMLPDTIWRMAKLRHLHVSGHAAFSLRDNERDDSCQLDNLVTFSSPYLSYGKAAEKLMRRFPKLQKLRCIFSQSQDDVGKGRGFPIFESLTELESLNIFYSGRIASPSEFNFPSNLKKLTLSNFRLPWSHVFEIGRLPNLEILKLLSRAFEGKTWDMREGEFPKLKFLKLDTLNIAQWNASSDHLPRLEHLVLRCCKQLEEVPCGFADIPTLQMIEIKLCRNSVEESVKRLKEEQLEVGNMELKVVINI